MSETASATAILAPIWRRKWLILIVGIVVGGATYLYYKHQPASWQSETKLYLNGGGEEIAGEKATSGKNITATQQAQPQIINSLIVESAHRQLRKEHNHIAKLAAKGKAKAKAGEKSQFVTITAEARTPKSAALLANTVAEIYVRRRHDQYEKAILTALVIDHRQLKRIEAATLLPTPKGKGATALGTSQGNVIREAQLVSRINQLEAQLGNEQVQQLAPARPTKATLLGPLPKKNAEFGFVIGLLLAAIAAYLLGRFDRRLRMLPDVEAVFHAPIIAALPQVRQPIIRSDGSPRPSRQMLEPLRLLHTTLLISGGAPASGAGANGGAEDAPRPRTILFVSPDGGDGRSTVVADLALVEREAGERAAVIEADLRRPAQARLLGLAGHSGLVDVLAGALSLQEALQTVPAMAPEPLIGAPRPGGEAATALASREPGAVRALPGQAAATLNPPALLASEAMRDVLRTVADECDHVLVDAPPPLEFSDAIPLLRGVDAIVIVARIGHTHERSAERLRQLLAHTPSAPVLGVVVNAVPPREIQRYGMPAGGLQQGWLARLTRR